MRELRESLRHAALLNIMAAANDQEELHLAVPPPSPQQQQQHHYNLHPQQQPELSRSHAAVRDSPLPQHVRLPQTPLELQVRTSKGPAFPQHPEGSGRSAGGGTYHFPSGSREGNITVILPPTFPFPSHGSATTTTTSSSPPPIPQQTLLVAKLLTPRTRTISIPRPGAKISSSDLPGPYVHKSLSLQAGQEAPASRAAAEAPQRPRLVAGVVSKEDASSDRSNPFKVAPARGAAAAEQQPLALPINGHALLAASSSSSSTPSSSSPSSSPVLSSLSTTTAAAGLPSPPSLLASESGGEAALTARGSPAQAHQQHPATTRPPLWEGKGGLAITASSALAHLPTADQSAGLSGTAVPARRGSHPGAATNRQDRTTTPNPTSTGYNSSGKETGREDRQGTLRKHLTPGKKRDLVKKLTEMAMCEAVDISDPVATRTGKVSSVDHNNNDTITTVTGNNNNNNNARAKGHSLGGANSYLPAMIILSPQRSDVKQQHHPQPNQRDLNDVTIDPEVLGEAVNRVGVGSSLYRAKSLSSLVISSAGAAESASSAVSPTAHSSSASPVTYRFQAAYSGAGGGGGGGNGGESGGGGRISDDSLAPPHSGCMPDLRTASDHKTKTPLKTEEAEAGGSQEGRRGSNLTLFTDGIVGTTFRKEAQVKKGDGLAEKSLPECSQLTPATPSRQDIPRQQLLPRRTRPSARLRDRGPRSDPSSSVIALPGQEKSGSGSASAAGVACVAAQAAGPEVCEPSAAPLPSTVFPSRSPGLPSLTITGLTAREKTALAGVSQALEQRPALFAASLVTGSLELFQQLDDQCEKLQRQLNLSLNVPRKRARWQNGGGSQYLAPSHGDSGSPAKTFVAARPGSRSPSRSRLGPGRTQRAEESLSGNLPSAEALDQRGFRVPSGRSATEQTHLLSEGLLVNGHSQDYVSSHISHNREGVLSVRESILHAEEVKSSKLWQQHRGLDGVANAGTGSMHDAHSGHIDKAHQRDLPICDEISHDPVIRNCRSLGEPRYQGYSSKVPETESRSQFHYIIPPGGGGGAATAPPPLAAADTTPGPDRVGGSGGGDGGSVEDSGEEREEPARKSSGLERRAAQGRYRVLKALDQDVYYDFQHRKYRNSSSTASPAAQSSNNEQDRPRVHFYKVKVSGEDT